jgi:arylsulfatase A-like enzyme
MTRERKARPIRWYGTAAVAALAAWSLTSLFVVPVIIRSAYNGTSFGWLNGLISGQAEIPVEQYLQIWRSVAVASIGALGVAMVVILVIVRFRERIAAVIRPLLWADPALGGLELVGHAVWWGLAFGIVEVVGLKISSTITGIFSRWSNPEAIWMIPAATTVLYLVLAAVMLMFAVGKRRIAVRTATFLFFVVGSYGVVRAMRLGLHPLAALVLTAGAAAQVARTVTAHAHGFRRLVRRTSVPALALLGVFAAGRAVIGPWNEGRTLAALVEARTGVPNIVLIILDTVRAQNLGVYGYARPTTPTLSELAETGIVFDRAISTAPWTLPSHASIFTGRFHHELSTDFEKPLDETYPTLAEALSREGYATGGFVANVHYAAESSGLARGFAHYDAFTWTAETAFRSAWMTEVVWKAVRPWFGFRGVVARKSAERVNEDFLRWLPETGERPFFAFLNYFDAHAPYVNVPEFMETFPPEPPRDSIFVAPGEYQAAGTVQDLVDRYDAAIASMDREIARLLGELERRGLLANTLVIVASDHGEHLGEYGRLWHANGLRTPVIQVPLLILPPSRLPSGIRVDEPVTIRDIAATIQDVIGSSERFPGTSLAPYWIPGSPERTNSVVLADINPNPYEADQSVDIAMRSIMVNDLHYIVDAEGREMLFDVRRDPWEEDDLSDQVEMADSLARLRTLLQQARDGGTRR